MLEQICQKKCSLWKDECIDYISLKLEKENFKFFKIYLELNNCSFHQYLYISINFRAIEFLRSKLSQKELYYTLSIVESKHQDEKLIFEENNEIMDNIIDMLSKEDKLSLELRYELGYSNTEIAEMMGFSPKNVSHKIARIHAKMKKYFKNNNYRLEDFL